MRKLIWGIVGGIFLTIADIAMGALLAPIFLPTILGDYVPTISKLYLVLFPYTLLFREINTPSLIFGSMIFLIGFLGGWQFGKRLPGKNMPI